MGKITSKEIAKIAGVSVSTVSIVMNNKPGVSDETRQQILALMASHGMVPKPNMLQNEGRTFIRFCKIVKHGQIINDRHAVFIGEYIDGMVEEAKSYGISVEVSTYQGVSLPSIVEDLEKNKDIKGCILLATELCEEDLTEFSSLSLPHVFLDAIFPFALGSFVSMDNYGMIAEALRYVKDCGHTRIGFFSSHGASNTVARENAFISYMGRLGLDSDRSLVVPVQTTLDGCYEDVKTFLAKTPASKLPTAFLSCNDIVAYGAIRALEEAGLPVPAKVSVIGFDDLPLSSLLSPPLTTLSVPKVAIGKLAVRVLLNDWYSKSNAVSQKSLIGGDLICRSSVRSLR